VARSGDPPLAFLEQGDRSRFYRDLKAQHVLLRLERAEAEVLQARRKAEGAAGPREGGEEVARLQDRLADGTGLYLAGVGMPRPCR
jgi:hypothetical protein